MPSSIVVNLRLPRELAEATRARAAEEERTASAVIRRALKRDLEHQPDHSDWPDQPEDAP